MIVTTHVICGRCLHQMKPVAATAEERARSTSAPIASPGPKLDSDRVDEFNQLGEVVVEAAVGAEHR